MTKKEEIILLYFDFLESGNKDLISELKIKIKKLAKKNQINIREYQIKFFDKKQAFIDFIGNKEGTNKTYQKLYNSLK